MVDHLIHFEWETIELIIFELVFVSYFSQKGNNLIQKTNIDPLGFHIE